MPEGEGIVYPWSVPRVPLEFDEKAQENLEAVDRLLPDEEGRDGLSNAAASRAYYAAYHAVAHVAQREGRRFTKDDYYRHDTLPDEAFVWGILDDEQRLDLQQLLGLRIKADYDDAPVELDEADQARQLARALVERLLA